MTIGSISQYEEKAKLRFHLAIVSMPGEAHLPPVAATGSGYLKPVTSNF
jgi:hypothetical protein